MEKLRRDQSTWASGPQQILPPQSIKRGGDSCHYALKHWFRQRCMTISGENNCNIAFLAFLPPFSNSWCFVREVRFQEACTDYFLSCQCSHWALSFFSQGDKWQAAAARPLSTGIHHFPYRAGFGNGQAWTPQRWRGGPWWGGRTGGLAFHLTLSQAPPLPQEQACNHKGSVNSTGLTSQ